MVIVADVHDKATRSFNMSRIRGANTKPELIVRKFLFAHGFRYRLNYAKLPGKPDIVLPRYRLAIFVHGCFWHGHKKCKYFVLPKTRPQWWKAKIEGTRSRDKRVAILIKKLQWRVITIHECQLRTKKKELTLRKIIRHLANSRA